MDLLCLLLTYVVVFMTGLLLGHVESARGPSSLPDGLPPGDWAFAAMMISGLFVIGWVSVVSTWSVTLLELAS